MVCLCRSGTVRGEGGRSELGGGESAVTLGSSWRTGVGSSLSATSRWQAADRESESFWGSREFLCPPFPVASVTSLKAACSDRLTLDLSSAVLQDKRDILGFLLAKGSVYSSGREGFGRRAGEELGVSLSGLTWASGTERRFCCGWNSLLHRNIEDDK